MNRGWQSIIISKGSQLFFITNREGYTTADWSKEEGMLEGEEKGNRQGDHVEMKRMEKAKEERKHKNFITQSSRTFIISFSKKPTSAGGTG